MTHVVYLGFTGRSAGMTEAQLRTLRELLDVHDRSSCVALHNDGEGGDKEFAALAAEMGFRVGKTRDDLRPMPRNRELVALSTKLFAAPPTDFLLKKGSGSWETVKYAWKKGIHTFIVLSDGTLVTEKEQVPDEPSLVEVSFDDRDLIATLSNGDQIRVSLSTLPRLLAASADERSVWQGYGRRGIHFPLIDEDVSLQKGLVS